MISHLIDGAHGLLVEHFHSTEAPWYLQNGPRLAAPLIENPFTHGEIGVLMRKGQDDLLVLFNAVIAQMKADGTLRQLHEKYGLVYGYE